MDIIRIFEAMNLTQAANWLTEIGIGNKVSEFEYILDLMLRLYHT